MKQTAAMSLGILGLNEDFVQMNKIMNLLRKRRLLFTTNIFSELYN